MANADMSFCSVALHDFGMIVFPDQILPFCSYSNHPLSSVRLKRSECRCASHVAIQIVENELAKALTPQLRAEC